MTEPLDLEPVKEKLAGYDRPDIWVDTAFLRHLIFEVERLRDEDKQLRGYIELVEGGPYD